MLLCPSTSPMNQLGDHPYPTLSPDGFKLVTVGCQAATIGASTTAWSFGGASSRQRVALSRLEGERNFLEHLGTGYFTEEVPTISWSNVPTQALTKSDEGFATFPVWYSLPHGRWGQNCPTAMYCPLSCGRLFVEIGATHSTMRKTKYTRLTFNHFHTSFGQKCLGSLVATKP